MLAGKASIELGWPDQAEIFEPRGPGRRVLKNLAVAKVEAPLIRAGAAVRVGVLPADISGDKTESPLAIVCEFSRQPTNEQLDLAHRLAWNFCRTRLLITLERQRIRAWSCCLPPTAEQERIVFDDHSTGLFSEATLTDTALHALHWVSLTSGAFFQAHEPAFRKSGRADSLLLENLRDVRQILLADGVPKAVCHDLLARLIFVQFLFQRQDSQGRPFLDEPLLRGRLNGQLSQEYLGLADILRHRDDTYALFRWLNERFNGDLFPGKGETPEQREREWEDEKKAVSDKHLRTLAEFVSGEIQIRRRQKTLWPMYSFDTIPLEFISSVYEQFVSEDAHKNKAYYTRSHLVDYMLDNVLPWDSDEWDLRVLDPCCGSGIFLVKAFQRLIHRWRNAHPGEEPSVPDLKPILSKNLFGIDIDTEAVRVASFSLYLAMCDAIDPRQYWKQTVFPRLRDCNLIAKDFFREDTLGFRTNEDAESFDLILGNAPWGKNTIKPDSPPKQWAKTNKWPTTINDIGPLFIAKAARLAKPGAWVSMIQPSGTLLFNPSNTAVAPRRRLFESVCITEITNLSALRFVLFNSAVGGACTVTLRNCKPSPDDIVVYICPKETKTSDDEFRVVIEPNDINEISQRDVLRHPHIWTSLAWGGWRDVELITKLGPKSNLSELKRRDVAATREGIIRGNRKKTLPHLAHRKILNTADLPSDVFLTLPARVLPNNDDVELDGAASTDFSAFELPQLIIKQSWLAGLGRFRAVIVEAPKNELGVLCSDSYVSVHVPHENEELLHAACLVFNSSFATYFQLLTSGRFATYRPAPLESELRQVPLPEPRPGMLDGLGSFEDVDQRVYELFGFKPAERTLIEDLFEFTLPDFKGDANSPGRLPTSRRPGQDPDLRAYSEQFMRVLRAGFGSDKEPRATIFQESGKDKLPVRLLAIHLHWPQQSKVVQVETTESAELLERLTKLYREIMRPNPEAAGFVFERHARLYVEHSTAHGPVPTVFMIKPDQRRHWTRSQALRDADEVVAEILRMRWSEEAS